MDNVNEKRTEEEFGYKINDLKENSEKLIYRICKICKKEELRKARCVLKMGQTKCSNCSNKINANKDLKLRSEKIKKVWKEKTHPRLGVPHTDECKKRMSNHRLANPIVLSDASRKKISEATSGEKNGFYGKKHTKEAKKIMSESKKITAKRGKESPLYGKAFYGKRVDYISKSGEVFKLRSSWEEKTAKYLDLNNIVWSYESQAFPVTYEFEGEIKDGTYIPDFFLENGEVWEVKGYWRKDALAKFEAFKKTYPDVKIILMQKKELMSLGIL